LDLGKEYKIMEPVITDQAKQLDRYSFTTRKAVVMANNAYSSYMRARSTLIIRELVHAEVRISYALSEVHEAIKSLIKKPLIEEEFIELQQTKQKLKKALEWLGLIQDAFRKQEFSQPRAI
jgi:hypothetical protein